MRAILNSQDQTSRLTESAQLFETRKPLGMHDELAKLADDDEMKKPANQI